MDYNDLIKSGKALYLRKVVLTLVPDSGDVTKITNLRIRFNVEKTNESTPNAAQIEVYNLSKATRALAEAPGTRVLLEAGYESTFAPIFSGNVTKVAQKDGKRPGKKSKKKSKATQTLFDGPDIITRIECGDGDNSFRNAEIDMGFPAGASTRAIFKALSKKMGLPPRWNEEDIPDTQYAHGASFSGLVREHLVDLCRKNGLEWSIQDERLQIIPEGKATRDEAVVLSAATGLVGSPCKTSAGVEFVSLLQPKLRPGRLVDIQARALKGMFKVRKVLMTGDSRKDLFVSKCEATI